MARENPYKLEACVVSLEQALYAQQRGADRVEICSRLETEGMTPDTPLVATLCKQLQIPVRVMIRSTAEGFEVNENQLQEMVQSIIELKSLPVEGFVVGIMRHGRVDRQAMMTMIHHAFPFPITFHKAIDQSNDLLGDIEWLNQFPQIDTLLTSGGAVSATAGIEKILLMKSVFKAHIMGAGKITPGDLPMLHDRLDLGWYHGRGVV
jgi:copper homeostasis protein